MVMVDDLTGACFDPPVDPPRWIESTISMTSGVNTTTLCK